jgi:hypothetical protein
MAALIVVICRIKVMDMKVVIGRIHITAVICQANQQQDDLNDQDQGGRNCNDAEYLLQVAEFIPPG